MNKKKTKKYKIPVVLVTCVSNREYVITNCTYNIENTVLITFYITRSIKLKLKLDTQTTTTNLERSRTWSYFPQTIPLINRH